MNARRIIRLLTLTALVLGGDTSAQNEKTAQDKAGASDVPQLADYRSVADRLIRAATETDFAHKRLAELCDTFGPRFSGTTNLEAAIDWVLAGMKADGLENVRGEEVRVPHWVRGDESIELLEPNPRKLAMLGLGGSVN